MDRLGQREKLKLLDFRMRNPSSSPIRRMPENNFANIKQKVNDLEVFKNSKRTQSSRNAFHTTKAEEEEGNDSGGGDQFLYQTPPPKGQQGLTKAQKDEDKREEIRERDQNDDNDDEGEKDEEEEEDSEEEGQDQNGNDSQVEESAEEGDIQENGDNDGEEDENEDIEDDEEEEVEEEDQKHKKQLKNDNQNPNIKHISILQSTKASQNNKITTHNTKPQRSSLKDENNECIIEPAKKKVRVSSSSRVLFLENTTDNAGGQKESERKRKNTNQQKICKITDYLNASERELQLQQQQTAFQQQLNKYEQQIQQLKNGLAEKEGKIMAQKKLIDSLSHNANYKTANNNPSGSSNNQTPQVNHRRVKRIVQSALLENASLNRKLLKMQLQQSKQRLGEYTIDGTNFREQWVDGFEVQDLHRQLKEIEKKIASLQASLQDIKTYKKTKNTGKPLQKKLTFATSTSAANVIAPTEPASSNNSNNNLGNSASGGNYLFDDSDEELESLENKGNQSKEEQRRQLLFQISLLEKQREALNVNLEQKKREVKEIIKKYQLQYLEENSRFGGLTLDDPWPVLGNRYQLLSLLGKGGFSEVYKAHDLEELRQVAVKVHYVDKSWSNSTKQNYLKHAFREHGIQKELSHPNIVRLYDHIEIDSNSFASVLEYCEGPDLSSYLKTHQRIEETECKFIIKKILDCLAYLNSFQSRVIHYDLKPQNVIFHKGQIKITDFGLSKIIEDNNTRLELTSQGVGTYWYLPPECFLSEGESAPRISSKVDIWSVGVMMFEMIYGQKPFGNRMTQQQILQHNTILNSKEVHFPSKPIISKDCHNFILGCLRYNQEERFDIVQALQHSYFKKI